jgi:hypothetical protein
MTDVTDHGKAQPSPLTTPQFTVTLSDGTRVNCGFSDVPRAAYERWLKKYPPGTVVTVEGTNWGRVGGAYELGGLQISPDWSQ